MHQKFNIQQLYALPTTVFMCFVFIWEQTATCATYSMNWLVFITEMKSVYSAVRTGSLNKAVWASSLMGYFLLFTLILYLVHIKITRILCRISYSHGDGGEDYSPFKCRLQNPEDGGSELLSYVDQHTPVDQTLHPRAFQPSSTVHTVPLVWGAKTHFHAKRGSHPSTARLLFNVMVYKIKKDASMISSEYLNWKMKRENW